MLDTAEQFVFQFLANDGFLAMFVIGVLLAVLFRRRVFVDLWAYLSAIVLGYEFYFENNTCEYSPEPWTGDLLCGYDWFKIFFQLEVSFLYLGLAILLAIGILARPLYKKLTYWHYTPDSESEENISSPELGTILLSLTMMFISLSGIILDPSISWIWYYLFYALFCANLSYFIVYWWFYRDELKEDSKLDLLFDDD